MCFTMTEWACSVSVTQIRPVQHYVDTVHHNHYPVCVSQSQTGPVLCLLHRSGLSNTMLILCIMITILHLFHRLACSLLLCIIITLLYLFHRRACSLLLCIIIPILYLFHRLACSLLLCIIRLFCVCFTE